MCNYIWRTLVVCGLVPRKRVTVVLLLFIAVIFTLTIWDSANVRLKRETAMEQKLAEMREHIVFLESMYLARHEEIMRLKTHLKNDGIIITERQESITNIPTDLTVLMKNITGTHSASGFRTSNVHVQSAFVLQLMPHLMDVTYGLRPAYHMKSCKNSTIDIVLGIPTVRRDKENYLMLTLESLIKGLSGPDLDDTLIVVYVGETDLEYVVKVARDIETKFPASIENGLIEVISPPVSYYPNLEKLEPNLGDSRKRFRWRTKQNLDTMYLMAYVRTKAPYYLMLEDDILASATYMQEIKIFTASVSVLKPNWFFIEFCPIGGIGKLFRSSDLLHFITYVQLFYDKFPIDWLLDKYLMSRVCTLDHVSEKCKQSKLQIRPKYKSNLFQHIGLYSSLKGKIQKIKDTKWASIPTFYAHNNPPLASANTTIKEHESHTLINAYLGQNYFWGIKPKKNDTITFMFMDPTFIERYLFRSGNTEHITDKFLNTVVEVVSKGAEHFIQVGEFDEFGLAEGTIAKEFGALNGIRLRVVKDLAYWALLSEIELVPALRNASKSSVARDKKTSR